MAPADCPAKSSFMQLIYTGGKLVGKLTVHYLNNYHEFSEDSIRVMETVAEYLGLLIGRVNEKKAEIARIKAESENKAKTEFLFNMSHDIRTPMNAILGFTDIGLNHINDTERTRDSFLKIKQSGGHLLNLINDILEMSRIESGKLELDDEPIDMYGVIENVNQMCKALAIPKSIDFQTEIGDLKNPYVYADELHGNEVVINLISNAIKYTPHGGKVRYYVNQISDVIDGKVTYRFEVVDNGIGMSEEYQRHLFEAFSRENTSTVSKQEGAGLGLSIVKKILNMAGGTIRVKSKQNEGSSFTVEVPFRVLDDEAIEKYKAEHAMDEFIPKAVSFEGKRVLLVEDNEMNREIAEEILTEAGLVVDIAEDGELSVKAVLEKGMNYYDFILMDIQMPVMNGYEATRAIRALPGGGRIPILALSANAFEEDRMKSLEAGMNAHVAKPINIKELFDALSKFM
jgi:Signal transduction histidine kinase